MNPQPIKTLCRLLPALFWLQAVAATAAPVVDYAALDPTPFGDDFPALDSGAVTGWEERYRNKDEKFERFANQQFFQFEMDVPRDEVIAFALYTCAEGQLKLSAQLFPLKQGESMEARLELEREGKWVEVAREPVAYPGWSAHFRIKDWDTSRDVRYRVRHGEKASFEGVVRRDPVDKDEIVVANMSCSGYFDPRSKPYAAIVRNLKKIDPDLLFFAGDQTYHHTQHTFGWLLFGMQFREVMRDRPTVSIPDDHDVGHGNLWGAGGKLAKRRDGQDGGYKSPPAYVNMVQRQQTWHLPDPFDPDPVERGIGVYYTSLRLGGVDFAILEDRKWKSPPRAIKRRWSGGYDRIRTASFDLRELDKPGLVLLGERQEKFLDAWSRDWAGVELKVALSQTAFSGAVTQHGVPENRMLADLDCNSWPQSGRDRALRLLRRVGASHLCGDQHLGVVVKHGIDGAAEGPYAFTSPALRNSIFGRWWMPESGEAGEHARGDTELKWTGDYRDGLGNPFRMLAYANPPVMKLGAMKEERADGVGIARFNKKLGTTRFECWSRQADAPDDKQFPGWPVGFNSADNDSREPIAWLEPQDLGCERPVVEVIRESDGKTLYVRRLEGRRQRLPVFSRDGLFTVKAGADRPDKVIASGCEVAAR